MYYRLLPQVIHLPSLKERMEDLPELCAFFLKGSGKHLSPSAQKLIETLEWRGNVRELKNCLLKAVHSSRSMVIEARDLRHF